MNDEGIPIQSLHFLSANEKWCWARKLKPVGGNLRLKGTFNITEPSPAGVEMIVRLIGLEIGVRVLKGDSAVGDNFTRGSVIARLIGS